MNTKTLKLTFAGIAVAIISFTVFFASSSINAQDELEITNEVAVDDMDDTETATCNVQCTDKADCEKQCEDLSNCDPSNCDEACMDACHDKIQKTCQGNTTCSPGCEK